MKKFLLLIAIIVFVSGNAIAQDLRLGFAITPNVSWFKSDNNNVDTKSKIGFGYGLIADFAFADRYAFSTGLNIMHTGGKFETFVDNQQLASTKINMQYIEIPATLKLITNEMGYFKFYGQLGLTPAVAIRTRYSVDYTDSSIPSIDNEKAKDVTKILNLGMTIGAGTQYAVSEDIDILAGLYFNNGFINALKKVEGDDSKTTLSYLGLKLGVMF